MLKTDSAKILIVQSLPEHSIFLVSIPKYNKELKSLSNHNSQSVIYVRKEFHNVRLSGIRIPERTIFSEES